MMMMTRRLLVSQPFFNNFLLQRFTPFFLAFCFFFPFQGRLPAVKEKVGSSDLPANEVKRAQVNSYWSYDIPVTMISLETFTKPPTPNRKPPHNLAFSCFI
jgi:hypothetical protein